MAYQFGTNIILFIVPTHIKLIMQKSEVFKTSDFFCGVQTRIFELFFDFVKKNIFFCSFAYRLIKLI